MHWRRHTEKPHTRVPMTAVLAALDEAERAPFLLGIYVWQRGRWMHEEHFRPVREQPYWWVPEDEFLATLPKTKRKSRG